MKNYHCDSCNKEVKPVVCAKCNSELNEKVIDENGEKVKILECAKCHGKIKSLQCCGNDMKCC